MIGFDDTSTRVPEDVYRVLTLQCGLATRGQLLEAGLSAESLRWRVGRSWRFVLPHVVSANGGRLDDRQRLIAAQLYAGDEARLTGSAASSWFGVTASRGWTRVDVEVSASRRPSSTGFVRVFRTHRPEPFPWHRAPLTLVSPARAVCAAARSMISADAARAIVIEAVQRRIVRIEDVRHELEAGPRRGSALLRDAVQDAEAGAWSVPEADLAAVVRRSRLLPALWLNPDVAAADGTRLPRPDGWLDDVGLAIQVHSRTHHADPDDWDATVMTDGVYTEYGVVVVTLTPRQLRRDPDGVLRRIERAYQAALRRPRPAVAATPIGHGLAS